LAATHQRRQRRNFPGGRRYWSGRRRRCWSRWRHRGGSRTRRRCRRRRRRRSRSRSYGNWSSNRWGSGRYNARQTGGGRIGASTGNLVYRTLCASGNQRGRRSQAATEQEPAREGVNSLHGHPRHPPFLRIGLCGLARRLGLRHRAESSARRAEFRNVSCRRPPKNRDRVRILGRHRRRADCPVFDSPTPTPLRSE